MTIKFKGKFANFEEKKKAFAQATQEGTEEQQSEALNEMLEALASDVEGDIMNQVNDRMVDRSIAQSRGANVLMTEEKQFFNAVIEEGGFKENETLPKTTQERVFEELQRSHPLLERIGIQNLGAVTEFIFSDPSGAAVWGPLFDDIKGQLNATFRKVKIDQLKLTAFIPLSNDMLQLGPEWIERYVRTMLVEAMSVGLERGFVAGDGKNQPIGLLKDPAGAVTDGVYPDKTAAGTLTFADSETIINQLAGVMKLLAKDKNDKPRNISGRVVMLVNPFDKYDIDAKATIRNDAGAYVTGLPYNPSVIESEFVPEGKVIFFIVNQYIAAMGGDYGIKKYTETMALEDATLYIAKQHATGKPVDEKAAQVYNLNIDGMTTTTTSSTTTTTTTSA